MNTDGKLDLAVANGDSNNVSILLNNTSRAGYPPAEVDSGVRHKKSGGAARAREPLDL